MDTSTARQIVRDARAPFVRIVEAANVIADDPATTLDDLLACMDHPGLPSDTARHALRRRWDQLHRQAGDVVGAEINAAHELHHQ